MNAPPRIACIETSARIGSVAMARGGDCLDIRTFRTDHNHAIELLPALEALCATQGWRPQDLDHLYLSIGPGSFTGLRIAVAVARTLAWSAGTRLVPVPTLSVIAHNALALDPPPPRVAAVLDAKRDQVYCAAFEAHAGGYRQILDARVRNPADLGRELGSPLMLTGEGIPFHDRALDLPGVGRLAPELWHPRAEWVHKLGWELAAAGSFVVPRRLTPLYLRIPEAEEVWQRRNPPAEPMPD